MQELRQYEEEIKDKDRRKLYQNKLGAKKEEVDEIMEQVIDYRKAGVKDDNIIIKAMQADEKSFGKERNSAQRVLLASIASKVNGDEEKLEKQEERLAKRKFSEEDINKFSDAIRSMYDML